MKKTTLTNIKIIILCNLVFSSVFAQCENKLIPETLPICTAHKDSEQTIIDALDFIPIDDGYLKVGGGVCISMGKQQISTDELLYNDTKQTITITTAMTYTDGSQIIQAQSAEVNLDNEQAIMSNVHYQINQTQANGKATQLTTNKKNSNLTGLTYSTCPPDKQQWFIQAESAQLDHEQQVGTFRKMSLKFKGIPLLYLPYAKMPLNNQRQTGFLIPEVSNSSNNGFELALPYYINIAENLDATLIPRYLTKRGSMLGAEFRYLSTNYAGEIYTSYLPSDKVTNNDRGYTDFKHQHKFTRNWSLNSRLSNVSDQQYFEDFGQNINATSQAYLYSFLNINGYGDNWLFTGQLNDYQILSDKIALYNQPYQTLPRLEYSWFNNDYSSSFSYGIDSQWAKFYRDNSITSNRLDITSYIEKIFQNNYSRLTPKLAYRYTTWNYDNAKINVLENNRALPIASIDYRINFEKQFSDGSFSSLEPRLFYLYAPYRNQQNIPLFDTHNLTFGTGLLYQSNSFSGADRQADANQLSIGVSQRHFDASGNERWNVTLGQINYFADRKVQLNNNIETRKSSPIITEFNYFYRNWKATMNVHWDTSIDKSERALAKFQYKGKDNSLFNFAYRFRKGKIEQLDTSAVLPIGNNNRIIARWNYSLVDGKTIELIAGLEHKSCCWAARLVGRRYVYNEKGDVNDGIFFELQLNGLGSIGKKSRRLLKQSILGYSEDF